DIFLRERGVKCFVYQAFKRLVTPSGCPLLIAKAFAHCFVKQYFASSVRYANAPLPPYMMYLRKS
ncbi:hypothetical protein, partial [Coleofasciculus sp. G2-EDA-02]|uniref:hypothetical protein n=1 Tax=Coleofasciculus sp. G2-EDA-02 TaxID=3069529 RepID=UPI003304BDC7